jgi:uncharacterized protein YbjT (DUF2867 family)
MQIFLTGANGFIGGAVAAALIAAGHKVRGLVRNKAKASAVAAHDVQAVVGSLDDAALLQAEAHAADAVVNAASSDHRGAVESLSSACSSRSRSPVEACCTVDSVVHESQFRNDRRGQHERVKIWLSHAPID